MANIDTSHHNQQMSLNMLESIAQAHLQQGTSCESQGNAGEEDDESGSEAVDSKVFTVNDIQTLLHNQLMTKNTHDDSMLTTADGKVDSQHQQHAQQQHLILVTQNGDRIILIQNPNASHSMEETVSVTESEPTNSAANELTITEVKSKHTFERMTAIDNQLPSTSYNRIGNNELDSFLSANQSQSDEALQEKSTSNRIQAQHRKRQALLMNHLTKLRDYHKDKIVNNEVVCAIRPNKRALQLCNEEEPFWIGNDSNDEKSKVSEKSKSSRSNYQSTSKSNVRISFNKINNQIPWYPQLCGQLQRVFAYVRRRSDSVDQLSKYFPSASHSFQGRCQELRKDMRKIELNIERFQNVLGKELSQLTDKLKTFFEDYHLESIASEIEEEERNESERLQQNQISPTTASMCSTSHLSCNPAFVPCGPSHELSAKLLKAYVNEQRAASDSYISKIELITPSSISITTTSHEPDDNDPVPEVRDIDCDAPLELLESFYTLGQTNSSRNSTTVRNKRAYQRKKDDHIDVSPIKCSKTKRNQT